MSRYVLIVNRRRIQLCQTAASTVCASELPSGPTITDVNHMLLAPMHQHAMDSGGWEPPCRLHAAVRETSVVPGQGSYVISYSAATHAYGCLPATGRVVAEVFALTTRSPQDMVHSLQGVSPGLCCRQAHLRYCVMALGLVNVDYRAVSQHIPRLQKRSSTSPSNSAHVELRSVIMWVCTASRTRRLYAHRTTGTTCL